MLLFLSFVFSKGSCNGPLLPYMWLQFQKNLVAIPGKLDCSLHPSLLTFTCAVAPLPMPLLPVT